MKTTTIITINGIDIVCFTETEKQLVPIKPILDAIGYNYKYEASLLLNDGSWSDILRGTSPDESDIAKYGLVSLPAIYIPGWVFNSKWGSSKISSSKQMLIYHAFLDYINK